MALEMDTARVRAARAGDPAALDAVATAYLPLVYNIVRRSLRHSADVDDVVQETMLQLVRGVGSLREPERLRAWLVAVTVNQIRDHQRSAVKAPAFFDDRLEIPDPGGEFVEHTLIRLDLSGQRRQTQQAAQWLDPDHRELLSLWWLEASGHLTRPELAEALQADSHHLAVRVSRMKEQLDSARRIVRVLARSPRCRALDDAAYDWDGATSSVWRKRFARHIRECPTCEAATRDLIAPERLLAGLALLPVPAAYAAIRVSAMFLEPSPAPAARPRHGAHRGGKATGMAAAKPIGIAFAAIAVVAVGAVVVSGLHPKQNTVAIATTSTNSALPSSARPAPSTPAIPTASVSPSPPAATSTRPTTGPTTAPARETSAAPHTSAAPVIATASTTSASSISETAAQQVLDVINQAREQNGLRPYTMSAGLIDSASAHDTRMEGGCGLSHQCPGEAALGDREGAAGVRWTSAGENIGEGGPVSESRSSIANMAVSLTNSMLAERPPDDGHRQNILSSSYTEIGIAVTRDSSGTVWMTQDFAGDG